LLELAKIVHTADTGETEVAPEGVGLDRLMTGVRYSSKDDFEALQKAAIMYDALYTYCKVKLLRENMNRSYLS